MTSLKSLVIFSFVCFSICITCIHGSIVSHDERAITIDGERRILLSGSIHYPRSTAEMWPDLIKKAKEGGLNTVETYVFWNAHEPSRRQYDFNGNLDLVRFIKTIQDEGLYAVLRIGPYVCAEWNYGGFPMWLHNMPNVEFRTANTVFMNEMQNFTTLIVDMMKQENLFASQGGPIILAQIENEYGNVMGPYGDAGKEYINWCASMANSLDIGVPWIMCQQPNAPEPMLETCNGFYCDNYTPSNPTQPKMWTENWTGWFNNWGGPQPFRTAEDLAFAVARFFQKGGTFQNYYMYHGGTNFGRTAGGPYITTSYDYNAPLDEYGNVNQPKWGHLKELHNILTSLEKTLTYGNYTEIGLGNFVWGSVYTTDEGSSCFIGNANHSADATVNFQGVDHVVPSWSVSILPDCKTVVYNTAKVNTQTSVMVKSATEAEDEPASLEWSWRPETTDDTILQGKGYISTNQVMDQKLITNDASDYLWYMTRLNLDQDDPILTDNMTIRVNTSSHLLHAYVNGQFVGSLTASYGQLSNNIFEQNVKLNPGSNLITLLSATVGLANYNAYFENFGAGITGPVQIVSYKGDDEKITKELTAHKWSYKVGLEGEAKGLFDPELSSSFKWSTESVPFNRSMTWYKTTFKAPLGSDSVVVDLQGLGKGMAWVNGHNIGRYWPSVIAPLDKCSSEPCDYRGGYNSDKCAFDCGKPSQRYYHVPRSFLSADGVNTIVLFEEVGGNPSLLNFKTVQVGTVCGNAYHNNTMNLSCDDRPISKIQFASYGKPVGVCGSFEKGACHTDVVSIVEKECLGKESCSVQVSQDTLGASDCADDARLVVEAVC